MAEDAATSRDPLDLLAEQFLQRLRRGEAVTPESFAQQHAEHSDALRELLPTLLLLEQAKRERESTASSLRRLAMPQLQRLGDFRIVREVGRGGMGVVFEAVQESLGRRVALKVLPQASLLTGNQLERFRREARTAAGLHHTHIVPVFDSGEADGFHYYAMQFIDGRSLDAVVKGQREDASAGEPAALRLRCALAARVGAEVAEALQHAHEQGTLHRDVKPANLMLGADQHVWVTDFGLAKALQQEGLTHSGDLLGTLQYMAPEQFDGVYDARSEVYALGATLYELVALRPAFRAETRTELIDRIRAGRCERLGRMAPGVPRDLETILARAMAPEAKSRYASARELAEDLSAFLADRPIAARQRSTAERLGYWCKRNRALAVSGAVSVAAVVIAAVVGWTAYWMTDDALGREKLTALAAQRTSELYRANLDDFQQMFEDMFDRLVGPDPLHALFADVDSDTASVAAMRAPVDDDDLAQLLDMLEFHDRFAQRNQDSPELRAQTARAYARVGAIHARLGDLDAAVAAYEQGLRRFRDVDSRDVTRDLAVVQQELGQVQVRAGQPRAAAECFQQSLALLQGDAADGSRSKRWLEARGHFLVATVPMFRNGVPQGPGRRPGGPRPPGNDGSRPQRPPPRGNRGERRPPELRGERRPGQRLADVLFERLSAEARGHLEAAQQLLAGLLAEQPDDAECLFLQARCLLAEPRLQPRPAPRGPSASERERQQQAVALLEKLVAAHPAGDAYRFELCEVLQRERRPRDTEVPAALQQAVDHARVLLTHEPEHPEYQALLARCLSTLGIARHEALGAADPTAGRDELQQALQIQRGLTAEREAAEPRFLRECTDTLRRLLRAQLDAGEAAAAAATARELVERAIEAAKLGALRGGDEGRPGDLLQLLERAGVRERIDELRQLLRPR